MSWNDWRHASDISIGQPRAGIACPRCGFVPVIGMQWICAPDGCGGTFDTFATRAECPHCVARFTWTACPACLEKSAHASWYEHSHRL